MYELVAFDMIWLICSTELKHQFSSHMSGSIKISFNFFEAILFVWTIYIKSSILEILFSIVLSWVQQNPHPFDRWLSVLSCHGFLESSKGLHQSNPRVPQRGKSDSFGWNGYVSTTRCSKVFSKHGCGSDEKWFPAVRDGCHFRWMRFDMSPLVQLELFPTDKTWQNRLTG